MYRDEGFDFIRDYIDWLSPALPENTMFRGHADQSWLLEPTAFRSGSHGIENIVHLRMWKDLASRFVSPKPTSPLEWLVLAQHYGIPTALLDWTSNPLTALFFAAYGGSASGIDGEIIGASRDFFNDDATRAFANPFGLLEGDDPILIDASGMNSRSIAQDSYMSLHHIDDSPMNISDMVTSKFPVPSSLKQSILSALVVFGISEERLYSDLSSAVVVFKRELVSLNKMQNLLDSAYK